MKVPAVEARVEGRSTVEDRQPRNSCRQVCCVFVAHAAQANLKGIPDTQVLLHIMLLCFIY